MSALLLVFAAVGALCVGIIGAIVTAVLIADRRARREDARDPAPDSWGIGDAYALRSRVESRRLAAERKHARIRAAAIAEADASTARYMAFLRGEVPADVYYQSSPVGPPTDEFRRAWQDLVAREARGEL